MFAIVIGNGDLNQNFLSSLNECSVDYNYINYDENNLENDLKNFGAYRADLLISLTNNDSLNLYFCKQAKIDFHIPITLALSNCSQNLNLMKSEGIDFVICPNLFISNSFKKILSLNINKEIKK